MLKILETAPSKVKIFSPQIDVWPDGFSELAKKTCKTSRHSVKSSRSIV